MSLFSLQFVVLLGITLLVYYIVPKKYQWIALLAASVIFYAFSGVVNLLFIGITALSTWIAGRMMFRFTLEFKEAKKKEGISKEQKKELKAVLTRKKKRTLLLVLLINFGILAYLKYWQVLYDGICQMLHPDRGAVSLGLLLPLGISFYTFQSMGYLIDQYRDSGEGEKNFFKFLLFVSFFPQLIQGPINRFGQMKPQFDAEHSFCWEKTKHALFLMLFGLLKKYAIADLLSGAVAAILDAPGRDMPGSVIVAGILMYSAQQYADFSGGIDLVLGIAELFGIEMMPNFRQPYFAVSLADFWRRWHISLGAWMRDYVFYPFALTKAMQRLGKWGIRNLGKHVGRVLPACIGNVLVFFIVGIWHGAESHYILWGLYNGIMIALAELFDPLFVKMKQVCHVREEGRGFHVFRIIRTFIIVNIGWYFDRIVRFGDCMTAFRNTILHLDPGRFAGSMSELMTDILTTKTLMIVLAAIAIVLIHSIMSEKHMDMFAWLNRHNIVIRWGVYYLMMILIQVAMSCGVRSEAFLYAVF